MRTLRPREGRDSFKITARILRAKCGFCVDCLWKQGTPENHKCGGNEKNERQKLKQPAAMLTHSFFHFNVPDSVAGCWRKNWELDKSQFSRSLFSVFLTLNQTSSLWRTNRTDLPPNEQTFFYVGLRLSNQSCPNTLPTYPCNVYHNIDCKPFTSSPLHDCTMCPLLKLRKLVLDKNISSQFIYKLFGTM